MMKKFALNYIFVAITTTAFLFAGRYFPYQFVQAQVAGTAPDSGIPIPDGVPNDADLEQCAYDLTNYMNTVLENVNPGAPSILTSISFNLTSPFERPLFQMMEVYGARFDQLEYFSGNTYTLRNDGVRLAYDFYVNQGWKADFEEKYGKEMIFTEYGDFVKHPDHGGASSYSGVIDSMKLEFQKAKDSGNRVIYFAPFPGNPEFDFHNFDSDSQLQDVVASAPGMAGANSAQELNPSGAFAQKVSGLGLGYTLEIITGPDVAGVVNYINGLPPGITPVIRSCWGTSCGMQDPLVLANFINDVDAQVSRPWHVLVGPNEPLTDPWVSPACGEGDGDREWKWQYVSCNNVVDPEYHSLRPYPASVGDNDGSTACQDPDRGGVVKMCGNSLIAQQTFTIPGDQIGPEADCVETIDEGVTYTFNDPTTPADDENPSVINFPAKTIACENVYLAAGVQATLDFSNSELPVLGNTEDVPNGENGGSRLSYEQRVNNYVSWYLQGVIPTAEEPFQSPTDLQGARNIINFSGPIHKLYPRQLMTGFSVKEKCSGDNVRFGGIKSDNYRLLEVSDSLFDCEDFEIYSRDFVFELIGEDPRHDQIVACGAGFPEACYSRADQTRYRKSEIRTQYDSLKYPYIPLTSTEDTIAHINIIRSNYGHPRSDIDGYAPVPEGEENPKYEFLNLNPGEDESFYKSYDELYLAHARESNQLAKLLQSTYIPSNFPSSDDSGMPLLEELEILPFCTIVDTYSNPGDNLYGNLTLGDATKPARENTNAIGCWDRKGRPIKRPIGTECDQIRGEESENIVVGLNYESYVSCEFKETLNLNGFLNCRFTNTSICTTAAACTESGGSAAFSDLCSDGQVMCSLATVRETDDDAYSRCIEQNTERTECTATATHAFGIETETPYLKEIFDRLVNGNMSFFRRIYPRLNVNNRMLSEELAAVVVPGPEDLIKNIPGETTVGFSATTTGSSATNTGTAVIAGDPAQGGGASGSIYFPYLGTIHKHFLTDVQCALRPALVGCDNSTLILDEENIDVSLNLCPVWVTKADADSYASALRSNLPNQRFASDAFAGWVAYYGGILEDGPDGNTAVDNAEYQHLFETCGGITPCYDYIINRVLAEGCAESDSCINPYLVIAIALNENGGLISFDSDATSAKHFGCDPWGLAGFENSIEAKLTCVINTLNNYNTAGLTDDLAMRRYEYANGAANANINKLMGILSNGTFDPECK